MLFLGLMFAASGVMEGQVHQDSINTNRSDTSQTTRKLEQQKKTILKHLRTDRNIYKYLTPESKRYNVPSPTEHYKPPFTGKKSLNQAMIAYRKSLENSITSSRFYQILTKIAPFINNVFVFGYWQNTAPVIGPDNPYLFPKTKKGKARHKATDKRANPQKGNEIKNNNGGGIQF
jgi:hypothetical protein